MLIEHEETVADKVRYILDEAEYELKDGIGFPFKKRTFSDEEHDDILGIIEYIRKKVDFYEKKGCI